MRIRNGELASHAEPVQSRAVSASVEQPYCILNVHIGRGVCARGQIGSLDTWMVPAKSGAGSCRRPASGMDGSGDNREETNGHSSRG